MACGGHGLLDPRGFIRGVGVAHGDQSVGEDEASSSPYSPECVEEEFREVRRYGVLRSWSILRLVPKLAIVTPVT
jgi:hypothetical protein